MLTDRPRASVLIPAHQEEAVIGRCLGHLLQDAAEGEFEVIVVANGCSDATAEAATAAARRLRARILVVELDVPSKSAALARAETLATAWPRVYLDADVACPTQSLRALVGAVENSRLELAVPERRLELTAASWITRAYYETWSELPWVRELLSGRGCYVLSRRGRNRFGPFPEVIADDLFVTMAVPAGLRRVVTGAPVWIYPPADVGSLLRVRSRVFAGNAALQYANSAPRPRDGHSGRRVLAATLRQPSCWRRFAVYAVVTAAAKTRGRRQFRRGDLAWGRARRHEAPV